MDEDDDQRKRPRGRPMDASLGPTIMAAVLDVLAEGGYARFTTAAVARRAGVSTATLYRRWPSKRELILVAAEHIAAADDADADTGSTEADIRALLVHKQRVLSGRVGAVLVSLVGESAHDPELAAIVHESIIEPTRQHLEIIFARTAARKTDAANVDAEAAAHLIVGTILARIAFASTAHAPAVAEDEELLSDTEVDLLVRALATEEGSR